MPVRGTVVDGIFSVVFVCKLLFSKPFPYGQLRVGRILLLVLWASIDVSGGTIFVLASGE
ncbi:Hypothetical protein Bdt_1075 [Bdellovibrio bacteriovorus str. Tiberius]|uniref:Uncharacterized protein n=1 Tax=Bdellovibrio bacteriovorus str. Tiberius TaxID=1069642 RepID=K7YVQ5_BDEBC|nr:Hypothetical protein Bdt_1075 [Bdellovibrio bacteriovorus str. Tiberius]